MKFALVMLVSAGLVSAGPVDVDMARSILEGRQASGCISHSSPTCCLPAICLCRNGWIYHVNHDNVRAGLHGCDPPWGFIATSRAGHPGYCCREGPDGEIEGSNGETVDESVAFISGHAAEDVAQ